MSSTRDIRLTVNGEVRHAAVDTRATLVDVLRESFRLTGTHVGCEHGVCGACTVLVDGEAVRGCLLLAVQADGRRVDTVEGLAPDAAGSPCSRPSSSGTTASSAGSAPAAS